MKDITLYAIRNEAGEWRTAGQWTKNFERAKIYTKLRPARGVISWFVNNFPEFKAPELIQFKVSQLVVLNETARIEKQKQTKARKEHKRELDRQQWRLEQSQRDIERAKADLKNAQERLNALAVES